MGTDGVHGLSNLNFAGTDVSEWPQLRHLKRHHSRPSSSALRSIVAMPFQQTGQGGQFGAPLILLRL